MELIPYEINDTFAAGWWRPMVRHGDDTYVAYTSPSDTEGQHYSNVAKRDSQGNWTTFRLQSDNGNGLEDARFLDDYGHNQTSIAIDGNGNIHVFTSMHNSYWHSYPSDPGYGHYYRSDTPGDISSMVDRSSEMPNQSSPNFPYRYTYPITCTDSAGDVYLIIRRELSGNSPLIMYRWNVSTGLWVIVGRVADKPSGAAYNVFVYPDDLIFANGKVHLAFSWHKNSASGRRHRASYLSYDPATGSFKTADGTAQTLPVDWTTNHLVYQPLWSTETTDSDDPLIGQQTARVCVLPNGNVEIAYRYRAVDYGVNRVRRARWVSSDWSREEVWTPGLNEDSTPAVALTHTGWIADLYYIREAGGLHRLWKATNSGSGWSHAQTSNYGFQRFSMDNGQTYAVIPPCGKQFVEL